MTERWKPVVGYEDHYEVSSLGRVRRVRAGSGATVGRVLRPCRNVRCGYLQVDLSRDGVGKQHAVHVLVAAAFLPPRPTPAHEVDHVDSDPTNCRASNLEWRTHAENLRLSSARGRIAVGNMQAHARLTERAVLEIRALAGIVPQRELAIRYEVGPTTISNVIARQSWRHVEEVAV